MTDRERTRRLAGRLMRVWRTAPIGSDAFELVAAEAIAEQTEFLRAAAASEAKEGIFGTTVVVGRKALTGLFDQFGREWINEPAARSVVALLQDALERPGPVAVRVLDNDEEDEVART